MGALWMRSPTMQNDVGETMPERILWWWTLSKLDKIQMKSKHKRSLVFVCARHWSEAPYGVVDYIIYSIASSVPTTIQHSSVRAIRTICLMQADLVAAIGSRNTESSWKWQGVRWRNEKFNIWCSLRPYRWHYFKIGNHCVIHCFLFTCPRFRWAVSCDTLSLLKSNVNEYVKKWLISIWLSPKWMEREWERAKKHLMWSSLSTHAVVPTPSAQPHGNHRNCFITNFIYYYKWSVDCS